MKHAGISAVAASLAIALMGAQDVAASPAPFEDGAAGPPAVISLGDSFISGEAGRWRGNGDTPTSGTRYGTDLAAYDCNAEETWCDHDPARIYGSSYDNGCNRSGGEIGYLETVRVGGELYEISPANRINVACSGATADAIHRDSFKGEPRQVDQLAEYARSKDVKLVVLSIGGNDLEFSEIIKDCVVAFTTGSSPCNETLGGGLPDRITRMADAVRASIRAIRATMWQARYDESDYRLVLQSYPSPLPRGVDNRYPENDWSRWYSGGCPFFDDDSDWAHDTMVPSIAEAHRQVAVDEDVEFLDLRDALDGHEVCAAGAEQATSANNLWHPLPESRSEWVRWIGLPGLGQGQEQEFLHPNSYGQQTIGFCLDDMASRSDREYICDSGAWLDFSAVDHPDVNQ
jgi:lysophospholipase L1-like esterase